MPHDTSLIQTNASSSPNPLLLTHPRLAGKNACTPGPPDGQSPWLPGYASAFQQRLPAHPPTTRSGPPPLNTNRKTGGNCSTFAVDNMGPILTVEMESDEPNAQAESGRRECRVRAWPRACVAHQDADGIHGGGRTHVVARAHERRRACRAVDGGSRYPAPENECRLLARQVFCSSLLGWLLQNQFLATSAEKPILHFLAVGNGHDRTEQNRTGHNANQNS
ncbi:hypothetical protein DFH27DRAFT_617449 [Peziza echinospora]|nr:hypothetical protein DFH27DRAFT_617449 [Peziza echinospora]